MSPSKPFTLAGSGIPKPTAAVKGTAKISVKKTTAPEAERTPGDGKEVAKCIHPPSEPSAPIDSDTPSFKSKACNGNPPEADSLSVQPEETQAADQVDAVQLDDGCLSSCAQVAKVLPMINSNDIIDDQSNGNNPDWVSIFPHPLYNPPQTLFNPQRIVNESLKYRNIAVILQESFKNPSRIPQRVSFFLIRLIELDSSGLVWDPFVDNSKDRLDLLISSLISFVCLFVCLFVCSRFWRLQRGNDTGDPEEEEEEEDEPMDVQPMTPLFTTTTALMKHRPATSGSPTASIAKSPPDTSDPPRVTRIASAYSDPLDGYLSEGGASLYARKLNYVAQRQKEDQDRWQSVKESLKQILQ